MLQLSTVMRIGLHGMCKVMPYKAAWIFKAKFYKRRMLKTKSIFW